MYALLMTTWLCLPLAPLNPIEQDTLATLNLHLTVGVDGPNGLVSIGPVVSTNWELLIVHPFMIRGTIECGYGKVRSNLFPKGNLWSLSAGTDAIYYRGTNHLTGYIGAGAFYVTNFFTPFDATADSLLVNEGTTDVEIQPDWGYRIILGMRYHRSYSLEIAVTELTSEFKKTGLNPSGTESRSYQSTNSGSFRVTLGYLFEI
jgi:hypothetical protein